MSQDEFDAQAEGLLPCCDRIDNQDCLPDETPCAICERRPAVAAALREQGKQLADLRAELDDSKDVAKVRKLMAEKYGPSSSCDILQKEIAERKARLAKLDERLKCGHRKVDFDDSYGECVFCKIKSRADDYERLPLTLIEAHDQIDELKERRDELAERLQSILMWYAGVFHPNELPGSEMIIERLNQARAALAKLEAEK